MMSRRFESSALALAALLAVGALALPAQATAAKGEFVAFETPVKLVEATLDGVNSTVHTFNTSNAEVRCGSAAFAGLAPGGTTKSLTLSAAYGECTTIAAEKTYPTTVTMNGCHWEFSQPVEEEATKFSGTMALYCPEEEVVVIDLFGPEDKKHEESVFCEITFFPNEFGGEVVYVDQIVGEWASVAIGAEHSPMEYEEHGFGCPDETGKAFMNGVYLGGITLTGTDGAKKQLDVLVIKEK